MLASRFETVNDRSYEVREGLEQAVMLAIAKTCFDIEALAKANVAEQDAIDTGSLVNSIYTVTPDRDTYDQAKAAAQSAAAQPGQNSGKPNKHFKMLPKEQSVANECIVAVGAEHGPNVEFGNVFVPPRTFFRTAAEDCLSDLDTVVERMINQELESI